MKQDEDVFIRIYEYSYSPWIKKGIKFAEILSVILAICISQILANWDAYKVLLRWEIKSREIFESVENTDIDNINEEIASKTSSMLKSTQDETQVGALDLIDEVLPVQMRIVIPKIDVNAPIVQTKTDALERGKFREFEKAILDDLKKGVVHFPGTSFPDEEICNVVVTGHSAFYPWDDGRYKDVFALLDKLAEKDRFTIYYDQRRYDYEVSSKKVVLPSNVDVLSASDNSATATIITCTPVGTALKRLVISAKRI